MALAGLINLIMPISMAVDTNCDYYQDVAMGQRYYIYSPGYPNRYSGAHSCRYIAQSAADTQIILSCEIIDLPTSQNCQQDRLAISLTGNATFQDAHNYCGKGALSLVSQANKISIGHIFARTHSFRYINEQLKKDLSSLPSINAEIPTGLFSPWYSSGGRFLCAVTAIKSDNPNGATTTEAPPACDCGWKQQRRIVGGEETGINEFPSMAALINMEKRELYCGATIISSKYALTAAHCVVNIAPTNIGLLVGDHNINTGTDTAAAALYVLERYETHPYYSNKTRENDIAVVRTQKPIVISSDVGPVCLPFRFSSNHFTGATVTALGWGLTDFSGSKSEYLQKVNLTVVTNENCRDELTEDKIFNTQICTLAPGKDACQYDSGGPILWYDSGTRRLHLVGIISYGVACAINLPAVNTRVTSYLAWIVQATSDADYCIK